MRRRSRSSSGHMGRLKLLRAIADPVRAALDTTVPVDGEPDISGRRRKRPSSFSLVAGP
ncbi:protein of unknown function [Nocardia cyriacigeorgica GUH-2]|uniref:Uncharacterized protein n=1 Tax=Nocardia cyriacigeorgica (strain GUH-2) TaxID=1127134 RepID=H6R9M6_NOCCG|nr:protein of unknown function [Nocardia cyriacigeorgica GUH-2]